ncbi:hypothetical protein AT15_02895 [Kosmotoga arenicorallina S304]|uniref:Uncharacterized protein n=1 Tax=Kosmotoga arenicorallina S304 TaxID=1453497 RepID=A0A176K432_9BACT|nr:prepilin-type N-terminal cleavage/methylation domain-containing protein [Kosmotoga arenicorallina]OAA31791.1 hypothetical protein AT15_02895 [Kosmotoga arenicorallina S304]
MKRGFSLVETIIALLVVGIFLISSLYIMSRIKEVSSENQHAVRFLAAKSAIVDFFMYSPSATNLKTGIDQLLDNVGLHEFEVTKDVSFTNPGGDENIILYEVEIMDTLTGRSEGFYVVSYKEK